MSLIINRLLFIFIEHINFNIKYYNMTYDKFQYNIDLVTGPEITGIGNELSYDFY